MLAELFHIDLPGGLTARLESLLRKHVDPGISLTPHVISNQGSDYRTATRYQQLLQASLRPGLSVSVTTMAWFENRIYVRIYWPIYSEGYWSNVEGKGVFFEGNTHLRSVIVNPREGGVYLFFPALAIYDRLVLAPAGFRALLKQVGTTGEANLVHDVLEVPFGDDEALDRAMKEVARELRQEVRRDVLAHRSKNPEASQDLAELARLLKVTPTFIEQSMAEEARDAAAIYAQLRCRLAPEQLVRDTWTKITLEIANDSDGALEEVAVSFNGPVEVLPAKVGVRSVPAHGTVQAEVSMKPADTGSFPLEIALVAQADRELADFLPRHSVWMESLAAPPAA